MNWFNFWTLVFFAIALAFVAAATRIIGVPFCLGALFGGIVIFLAQRYDDRRDISDAPN